MDGNGGDQIVRFLCRMDLNMAIKAVTLASNYDAVGIDKSNNATINSLSTGVVC